MKKTKEKKVNLWDIFLGLQEQMVAELTMGRENLVHPSAKGRASELCWVKMLNNYLPNRYNVESAFVVDCEGSISEQIDIVIFDRQFSPLILKHEGALYIPAESVYCVLEVKQNLNKGALEYAGEKAASVRGLRRTSAPIRHLAGVAPPKKPFGILSGILTIGSSWRPTLGKSLDSALGGLKKDNRIQIGCALQCGAFAIYRKGSKSLVIKSGPESSLIFFFLHLLSALQTMGTAPAMDIQEWGKVLWSDT